jgi:pseudaminic acid cytidylyltransferase
LLQSSRREGEANAFRARTSGCSRANRSSFSFPIQRAIRIAADGGVAPFFPQWIEQRSQDLEEAYHDAGAFYWGRAEAFRMGLPVFAAHSAALVLPPHRVQDIDNVGDWEHAERLYAALQIADSPPARV